MPRQNDNARFRTSRKSRHHKAMHSPAHGIGHSAKLRLKKRRDDRERCGYCKRPVKKKPG